MFVSVPLCLSVQMALGKLTSEDLALGITKHSEYDKDEDEYEDEDKY